MKFRLKPDTGLKPRATTATTVVANRCLITQEAAMSTAGSAGVMKLGWQVWAVVVSVLGLVLMAGMFVLVTLTL